MLISELKDMRRNDLIKKVRFIESGCSPMVVEVEYGNETPKKQLIKTENDAVLSFKNISQAYELCREAGINEAELVQVIPHDEACAGSYVSYDQQAITLKF
jgi:hypothetical protein